MFNSMICSDAETITDPYCLPLRTAKEESVTLRTDKKGRLGGSIC